MPAHLTRWPGNRALRLRIPGGTGPARETASRFLVLGLQSNDLHESLIHNRPHSGLDRGGAVPRGLMTLRGGKEDTLPGR